MQPIEITPELLAFVDMRLPEILAIEDKEAQDCLVHEFVKGEK